jgi:phosphatidylserine decarboxylase
MIRTTLSGSGYDLTLVPVAAILVAGIRLRFLDMPFIRGDKVRRTFRCDTSFRKGDEMGWFEHGSTIIVLAPEGFRLCDGVREGTPIRVGQAIMRTPQ